MTKNEFNRRAAMFAALQAVGFTEDECDKLRRISMTLHRWHELECGDGNGCIERDEETGLAYWLNSMSGKRYRMADRETGARRRLVKIISQHPTLSTYIQTDPRGAALYILRPGDVPKGKDVDAYYNRGICIY
jgi:hypothetical protein